MVGRMSSHDRGIVKDMIFAVAEGDVPKLKDSLMRFAVTRGDSAELDHSAFLSDLDFIVADFAGLDLKDLDIGEFLTSLLNLARKNDVELPSVVTMFARGMVTLEGLLTEYMPNVNMIQIIQTHIKTRKAPMRVCVIWDAILPRAAIARQKARSRRPSILAWLRACSRAVSLR